MTAYYTRSGATGSANGTSWANAYTTIAAALSGKAAGDIFYVSEDHAESTASAVTLTFPGTNDSPNLVYCVNHAGSVPPVSADLRTTGSIATTGNSAITINGSVIIDGLSITVGSTSGSPQMTLANTSGNAVKLKNCTLVARAPGATFTFGTNGTNACYIKLINTTLQFAASSASASVGGKFIWVNTPSAIVGSNFPATIFAPIVSRAASIYCEGVDLSAIGSGGTLVINTFGVSATFKDCKLNSAVTVVAAQSNYGHIDVDLINCDSGATNYRNERYRYSGIQTTETTVVRSGGASDGTTPVSHKVVTTANASWGLAFESVPIAIWNDTVGSSVTATIYGIWGGGAVPNNDDIWIEAEYLGSSGNPLGSFVSSGKADGLASNAVLASDSSTWGGSTTAFKMQVTFTPQQKGLVYITVKAAKASSTFYIDPKIELS